MTCRVRPAAVVFLVVALIAAACTDEAEPAGPEVFTPATGNQTDLTDPSTTLIPPRPEDPPEIEGPTLADFEVPCGRDAQPPAGRGIGLDDELIRIGSGNDRGARHAGSGGAGMPDAVAAMADHCTALGGLAGRGLQVLTYDAAVVEVADRAGEQCAEVLALVGAGYATPVAGLETWEGCGLPVFEGWPSWLLGVDPLPTEAHRFAAFAEPAAMQVGIVAPSSLEGRALAEALGGVLTAQGFTVTIDRAYSLTTETDWADVAAELVAAGVGLVHVDGPCEDVTAPLLSALAAVESMPLVVAGPSSYDQACLDTARLAGAPVERLLVQVPFLPLEDGAAAPVTQAFADILATYAAEVTGDTLLAAAAFWSFADAVDACADDLTRACLRSNLDGDGAGLVRRDDAACRVVLGVVDGVFERVVPQTPGRLACSP
ncbi:MAG: ABC transporter substrate-binding protein [Actinomycetota bacterium]